MIDIIYIITTSILSFCFSFLIKKWETEGKAKNILFNGLIKTPGVKIVITPWYDDRIEKLRTVFYLGLFAGIEFILLTIKEVHLKMIYLGETTVTLIGIISMIIMTIPFFYIYIIKYEYIREHIE